MSAGEATTAKIMALLDEVRRESYEQGWRDALQSIVEAATLPPKLEPRLDMGAAPVVVPAAEPETTKAPKAARGPGAPTGKRLRRGVAEEIVLLVLDAHRGGITIRGIEEASADLGTELQQQSIRVAMLRLEQAGRVARDGRSWRLTDEDNAGPAAEPSILVPVPEYDSTGGAGPEEALSPEEPLAT
jgi:hypothetical protein